MLAGARRTPRQTLRRGAGGQQPNHFLGRRFEGATQEPGADRGVPVTSVDLDEAIAFSADGKVRAKIQTAPLTVYQRDPCRSRGRGESRAGSCCTS